MQLQALSCDGWASMLHTRQHPVVGRSVGLGWGLAFILLAWKMQLQALSCDGWASMLHTRQHPRRRKFYGFGVGASTHLTRLNAVASIELWWVGKHASYSPASRQHPIVCRKLCGLGGGGLQLHWAASFDAIGWASMLHTRQHPRNH